MSKICGKLWLFAPLVCLSKSRPIYAWFVARAGQNVPHWTFVVVERHVLAVDCAFCKPTQAFGVPSPPISLDNSLFYSWFDSYIVNDCGNAVKPRPQFSITLTNLIVTSSWLFLQVTEGSFTRSGTFSMISFPWTNIQLYCTGHRTRDCVRRNACVVWTSKTNRWKIIIWLPMPRNKRNFFGEEKNACTLHLPTSEHLRLKRW